jgi:hypothetical protein
MTLHFDISDILLIDAIIIMLLIASKGTSEHIQYNNVSTGSSLWIESTRWEHASPTTRQEEVHTVTRSIHHFQLILPTACELSKIPCFPARHFPRPSTQVPPHHKAIHAIRRAV